MVGYEAVLDKTFIDTHDWVCDIEMLKKLMHEDDRDVVVLGAASNQIDADRPLERLLRM
jgi:hypothetical protein